MEVNGSIPRFGSMLRHEGVFTCPVHGEWKGNWFFDRDTDEPVGEPVCPKCRKEEEERERRENSIAVRNQIIEHIMTEAGVPETSLGNRFSNYVADTDTKKAKVETMINFTQKTMPSTIVMYGLTGTGKTHLAVAALAKVIEDSIISNNEGDVKYIKSSELLRDFKAAMNAKRGGTTENQLMHKYQGYRFLIVDEFNRFIQGDYNLSILQEIITHRIEHDLKTIVITNDSLKGFVEIFGDHAHSRLKMCGKSILFDEPDWRATHRRTDDDG